MKFPADLTQSFFLANRSFVVSACDLEYALIGVRRVLGRVQFGVMVKTVKCKNRYRDENSKNQGASHKSGAVGAVEQIRCFTGRVCGTLGQSLLTNDDNKNKYERTLAATKLEMGLKRLRLLDMAGNVPRSQGSPIPYFLSIFIFEAFSAQNSHGLRHVLRLKRRKKGKEKVKRKTT